LKVTLNWIKEFLGIVKLDPDQVAEMLTMSGTEVETMEHVGKSYDRIVVGQVKSFKGHPDADRLSLCKVDSGDGILDIVCGASNFKEGDKVALALVDACVGEMKIKRSKIRGQYSEGMMCSEAELGLTAESDGIMILDESMEVGKSFASQAGLDDVVYDLEVTPNRPDCLSVIGIAREISAAAGLELKLPDIDISSRINRDKKLSIDIEDYDLCSRYSAMLFDNIAEKQSPEWLKNRLILCGVRPKDLIVDLTNYVMLETGQPLHAFDRDLLHSDKIIVRCAKKGEEIRTIDDTKRKLDGSNLVIADEEKAVAIAGIMGGKNTEINDGTKKVLLESANFYGPSIMATSQMIGLRSEASNRFEKKIDPMLIAFALGRFEQMLRDITGYSGEVPVYDNNSGPERQRKIPLNIGSIEKVLGQKIEEKRVSGILDSLGLETAGSKDGGLEVTVPSFRYEDLEREIDLIEEVARIYGYNNIQSKPTIISSGIRGGYSRAQANIRKIKDILTNTGLDEVISYSFIGMDEFKTAMLDREDDFNKYISISNPINEDFAIMRTSLLPSLLKVAKNNINRKRKDISIFEVAKTFLGSGKQLPLEPLKLGILLSGKIQLKDWMEEERDADLFDLKGIAEGLIEKLYINPDAAIKEKEYSFFHPRISADIMINGIKTGVMGKVHPGIIEKMEMGQDAFYAEIDLDIFNSNIEGVMKYRKISSFPSIDIDLAIVVDKKIRNADIVKTIRKNGSDILRDIRLFDIYEGKQIGEGKKSLAYSLSFRGKDRTLKDKEVEIIVNKIVDGLEKDLNASLRS